MASLRIVVGSAVVACVVLLAFVYWLDSRSVPHVTITPLPELEIRVSVGGAVATPGVVAVASGARLADVLEASGGLRQDADVSGLNLAGRVGDGEHIVVPSLAPSVAASGVPNDEASGMIDLNVASAAELEALPGIGETLAARIVDYRESHGPFASVDELAGIDGISPRLVEELRPLVTVSNGR